MFNRYKYNLEAFPESNGLGPPMMKDFNFLELLNYGLIDEENNSIVPDELYLEYLNEGGLAANPRVFDFVADSIASIKYNFGLAYGKNKLIREGVFQKFEVLQGYTDPKKRYDEYLGGLLQYFNSSWLPAVNTDQLETYIDYFNEFCTMIQIEGGDLPITLSRFNKSINSSILDTGLAVNILDIPFDHDQKKIDQIVDQPSFGYFKNLCLNHGFSIAHNNPNILVFDVSSPAAETILSNRGIKNLRHLFISRYRKTCFLDLKYLFNIINIYYNQYVIMNTSIQRKYIKCGKTFVKKIKRQQVPPLYSPPNSYKIEKYITIRNLEEGSPYSPNKIKQIKKKSKYLEKKFDINRAIGYISNEFKDQVWNKNYGYHDFVQRLNGTTTADSGGKIRGQNQPSTNGGRKY